jgi:hypothetical protein
MGPEPVGHTLKIGLHDRDMKRERLERCIGSRKTLPVQLEKQHSRGNGGSFVPIKKGMVAEEAVHENGGFGRQVGIECGLAEPSSRTSQRRLQPVEIP